MRAWPSAVVSPRDVDDEDWARRSQENLTPITIGRLTVCPSREFLKPTLKSLIPNPYSIVIPPSMAFGTGHHATTELCLLALQALNLADAFVLDVGTGSGVLAIAARKLGAGRAIGIDHDPEAIRCANENLQLNPGMDNVTFEVADVAEYAARAIPEDDRPLVVTANLTGALLCRTASALVSAFAPGGALIVSGVLAEERNEVVDAFGDLDVVWEAEEDGWVGLGFARLL